MYLIIIANHYSFVNPLDGHYQPNGKNLDFLYLFLQILMQIVITVLALVLMKQVSIISE